MTCQACGKGYSLSRIGELGSTPQARYQRALAFAHDHEIDLASAYSVLLGILKLEECPALPEHRLRSGQRSAHESPPADEDPRSPRKANYDRGFKQAVSEGHLTVQQAVQRGDRVAWASRLAQKHRLSMQLAFLVADNRLTLREALAHEPTVDATAIERASHRTALRSYGVATLLLAVACIVAWGIGKAALAPDKPAGSDMGHAERVGLRVASPTVEATAAVRINPQGEVTEVVGPDPRSVLDAYCKSGKPDPPREALRLTPAADGWTGACRQRGVIHSITIRRDATSDRWIAGNGADPIRPRWVP